MYIKRILEKKIRKYLNVREIIAVVGARQSGKTTLLKQIFNQLENAIFLDFEDREKLELFETDIETFIKLYVKKYKYLFIDEFQYAKEGGRKLKYIFDSQKIKIILSGSSSSELSVKSIRFLVGRIFVFQLHPFSFSEYLSFKDENLLHEIYFKEKHSKPVRDQFNRYLAEFMIYGGYPRVVTAGDEEEKQVVLKNIYDTYFLREIKGVFNLSADFQLGKLLTALALQIGGILNYHDLSLISGLKYIELKKHLHVLLQTFITLESKPFFTNKRTELKKTPKIFFVDNGFRNTVIKNFQDIQLRNDSGGLRENFIASELAKKGISLNYWRTKSKAEVSFVVQKNGSTIPLEVKSHITEAKMSRSYRSFLEKYHPKSGFIVSHDLIARKKINGTDLKWLPIYQAPIFF